MDTTDYTDYKEQTVRQLYEEMAGFAISDEFFQRQGLDPEQIVKGKFQKTGPKGLKPGIHLQIYDLVFPYADLIKAFYAKMPDSTMLVMFGRHGQEMTAEYSFEANALSGFEQECGVKIAHLIAEEDDHFWFKAPMLIPDPVNEAAFIFWHFLNRKGVVKITYDRRLDFDNEVLELVEHTIARSLLGKR